MHNQATFVGRLTRDGELRYSESGTPITTLRLAVDRGTKNPQGEAETDFFDCIAFQQQAEFAANYGKKGRLTLVSGRMQNRSWTTQEGQKREKTELIIAPFGLKFLDKAPDAGGNHSGGGGGGGGQALDLGTDEDIPF